MDDIITNTKAGKTDEDLGAYRDKALARDSAFTLVYLLPHGKLNEEAIEKKKLFNITFYVVSYSDVFKYKTWSIIRAAYIEQFWPSVKQTPPTDKWRKDEDRNN